jgi:hypothetical protein
MLSLTKMMMVKKQINQYVTPEDCSQTNPAPFYKWDHPESSGMGRQGLYGVCSKLLVKSSVDDRARVDYVMRTIGT